MSINWFGANKLGYTKHIFDVGSICFITHCTNKQSIWSRSRQQDTFFIKEEKNKTSRLGHLSGENEEVLRIFFGIAIPKKLPTVVKASPPSFSEKADAHKHKIFFSMGKSPQAVTKT